MTRDWWTAASADFDLYTSQLVVNEARRGDPSAAARRHAALACTVLLGVSASAESLATRLVEAGAIPVQSPEDALHVAIAAVNGMDFLVTWNCKHIANARSRAIMQGAIEVAGYGMPVICTPEEIAEAIGDD